MLVLIENDVVSSDTSDLKMLEVLETQDFENLDEKIGAFKKEITKLVFFSNSEFFTMTIT
jgi:hypothetical protein